MKPRRGFTIVEIVGSLPVLAAVALVAATVFNPLARETPKVHQAILTSGSLQPLLRQIQRDVDKAGKLVVSSGDLRADARNLLMLSGKGAVHYRCSAGQVVRSELTMEGKDIPGTVETWPLPRVRIAFGLWPSAEAPMAVEVATAVEVPTPGADEVHMAGSRLFFLSAMPRHGRQP